MQAASSDGISPGAMLKSEMYQFRRERHTNDGCGVFAQEKTGFGFAGSGPGGGKAMQGRASERRRDAPGGHSGARRLPAPGCSPGSRHKRRLVPARRPGGRGGLPAVLAEPMAAGALVHGAGTGPAPGGAAGPAGRPASAGRMLWGTLRCRSPALPPSPRVRTALGQHRLPGGVDSRLGHGHRPPHGRLPDLFPGAASSGGGGAERAGLRRSRHRRGGRAPPHRRSGWGRSGVVRASGVYRRNVRGLDAPGPAHEGALAAGSSGQRRVHSGHGPGQKLEHRGLAGGEHRRAAGGSTSLGSAAAPGDSGDLRRSGKAGAGSPGAGEDAAAPAGDSRIFRLHAGPGGTAEGRRLHRLSQG